MPQESERLIVDLDDLDDLPEVPEVPEPQRLVITAEDLPVDIQARNKEYPAINPASATTHKASGPLVRSNLLQNLWAGLLGGLVGWAILEIFRNDPYEYGTAFSLIRESGIDFGLFGAIMGVFLGAAEGIVTKAWPKALKGGGIGLTIGFFGGFLGGALGQFLYGVLGGGLEGNFGTQIMIRSVSWALAGTLIGLAQGVSYLSGKKVVNGLLGGAIGGLLGGALFDIIGSITGGGAISRFFAFTIMGAFIGTAIGLVDEIRKQAWLKVISGPLIGKEYILFDQITTLGSSYQCDIVIYKDSEVMPLQATIRLQSGHYHILDSNPRPGTYINERLSANSILVNGVQVRMGSTVMSFGVKR